MNAEQVRAIDNTELKQKLRESEDQLFRLRFQMGMGQLEGLKKARELRKERARILTILREREIDPSKAPAEAAAGSKKKGKK